MLAMDLFATDAFGCIPLSQLINKTPYIPSQAGRFVPWVEQGYATTTMAIEELSKAIGLVSPSPRGGVGQTFGKEKRSLLRLAMPHFQIDDSIYADEVQNVRELGEENALMSLQGYVQRRMADNVALRLDPTLELAKLGAMKGLITYADSSTLDLFATFGVSQPAEVDMNLDSTANDGALRLTCAGIVRTVAAALGGLPLGRVGAFCSASFFDALVKNAEVRGTYIYQQQAAELRGGYAFNQVDFGGILWQEYRGSGSSLTIADDKANIFPMDVPGMFKVGYAPADYNETVNTIALPRYAKMFVMDNDKGYNMEIQTNPLAYCIRPESLVQAKIT